VSQTFIVEFVPLIIENDDALLSIAGTQNASRFQHLSQNHTCITLFRIAGVLQVGLP
jgi:hypothetical protein